MGIIEGAGTCSVCGKPSWHSRSNKCEDHKPAKGGRPAGRARATREQSTAAKIVGQLPAIDAKTFSGKAPTANEWEEKLTAVVVLLTMTYVEYAVIRPADLQEPYATQMTDRLGMTEDEARTIVEPVAHAISGTKVNKDHGREAIELLAFAPAILAVVEWNARVQRFKKEMTGEVQVMPETPQQSEDRTNGSNRRAETPAPAERASGVPVANFGGPGVWNPDEAPTARVHRDGADLDDPDRALEAAHIALNGSSGHPDAWVGVGGED